MNITNKHTILGLGAILLIASLSFAADGGNHTRDPKTGTDGGRHGRMERRAHLRQFVREMGFTDTQKAQALQAARTVQPIAETARADAKKVVEDARKANPTATHEQIRETVKPQIQSIRQNAATQILPSGRALLQSLTPDQRAKIQAAFERHGKTFDEERAARRIGFMLSRPRAVQFLEHSTTH